MRILRGLRVEWRRLKRGKPGRRFQDLCEQRRRKRGGSWSVQKLLKLATGTALVLIGPVVGLLPGPGGLLVFLLGLALLATEIRPAAYSLDRAETLGWKWWERAHRLWMELSTPPKIAIGLLGLLLIGACGYLGYAIVVQ